MIITFIKIKKQKKMYSGNKNQFFLEKGVKNTSWTLFKLFKKDS